MDVRSIANVMRTSGCDVPEWMVEIDRAPCVCPPNAWPDRSQHHPAVLIVGMGRQRRQAGPSLSPSRKKQRKRLEKAPLARTTISTTTKYDLKNIKHKRCVCARSPGKCRRVGRAHASVCSAPAVRCGGAPAGKSLSSPRRARSAFSGRLREPQSQIEASCMYSKRPKNRLGTANRVLADSGSELIPLLEHSLLIDLDHGVDLAHKPKACQEPDGTCADTHKQREGQSRQGEGESQ